MTAAQATLPFDIVLALHLTGASGTLKAIADGLAVVPSQVHASLARLESATLLKPGTRTVNARALIEFLTGGIRYAFPVHRERLVAGVPTAYSALPLSADVDAVDVLVWNAPNHPLAVQGFSIRPLYPRAPLLIDRAPATYQLVAIVDALRLGDPRVRLPARARLEAAFGVR